MRMPSESWSRLFRSLEGGADLHLGGELPTVVSAPRALPLYLPGFFLVALIRILMRYF